MMSRWTAINNETSYPCEGGRLHIWSFINGNYENNWAAKIFEKLSAAINTEGHEYDQAIAPDDTYMLFCSSGRLDGFGGSDFYISFCTEKGTWTQATNMGKSINASDDIYCPSISLGGKYIFFQSTKSGDGDIYWVDAAIVEELRPKAMK